MKDDNEKNLDYDERIRFHNEIINSTNGSVYKNNNSINVVNDKNKKREENKISNTSDKEDIKKELNNKNTSINNNINNSTNNYNNDENFQKVHVKVIATLICFIIFLVIFQNIILFLISMLFVILLGENFFKVAGKVFLFAIVVIAIVFGLCFLLLI